MAQWLDNLRARWFTPAAPDQGQPDSNIAPEGEYNDPLDWARMANYTVEPVHPKTGGYLPSWKFVPPPGFGDAPQHVFSTFTLIPLSVDGPGDRPAAYLRWITPQTVANFAMRWQGMAIDGGNILMTGLYTPAPLDSMTSDIFGD